jgi:hypothetical protein
MTVVTDADIGRLSCVDFPGADYMSVPESDGDGPLDFGGSDNGATFFAVVEYDGNANESILGKYDPTDYTYIWQGYNAAAAAGSMSFFDYGGNSWKHSDASVIPSSFHITEMAYDPARDGDELRFFINGTNAGTVDCTISWVKNSGSVYIGSQRDDSNVLDGRIAELILYKAALSDEERDRIGIYIENKYGISGSYELPIIQRGTIIAIQ